MATESGAGFRLELLNKKNYETWKIHMKAILIKGGNYKYVTDDPPDNAAELQKWTAGDQKAMADIILSIHPTELKQVKHCATTREVWTKLSEIYKSTGPARKATLLKSLLQMKMKNCEGDIQINDGDDSNDQPSEDQINDGDDSDDQPSDDQESNGNDSGDQPKDGVLKRAPGRPKIVRSGKHGRPKKVYNYAPKQNLNDSEDAETSFACSMLAADEISLEKAINSSDSSFWIKAISSEIESVIKNDTFRIMPKPADVESVGDVIGSRFILREKNVDGKIKKKARLIAQGFGQIPDINYFQNQTFSPVARMSSVRLMAALASKFKVDIHQFDITTAYLNGILDETVYMKIPKYFETGLEYIINNGSDISVCDKALEMLNDMQKGGKVCLLKKSLYGLKQSGRCWYLKLKEILLNFGFVNTVSDPCVFHMSKSDMLTILTVYVDDLLLISEDPDIVQQLHNHLSESLDVKYIGKAKTCLGIEFNNVENVITMSQRVYINKLLDKFNMSDCNGVDTPMEVGIKLTKAETHDDTFPYRELIGSLNYLAVCTRPDISYSISKLSQYLNCCDKSHWNAAKRVLKYLKKTINYGLIFNGNDMNITGFTDSDWGNDTEDLTVVFVLLYMEVSCHGNLENKEL